jgi:hypothetical protein
VAEIYESLPNFAKPTGKPAEVVPEPTLFDTLL